MSDALVIREDKNGIAILTLNRPASLNALSPNLLNLHLDEGLLFERKNSPGPGPDMVERLAGFGN